MACSPSWKKACLRLTMTMLMCTWLEALQATENAEMLLTHQIIIVLIEEAVVVHLYATSMRQCAILRGPALPYDMRRLL